MTQVSITCLRVRAEKLICSLHEGKQIRPVLLSHINTQLMDSNKLNLFMETIKSLSVLRVRMLTIPPFTEIVFN